MSRGAYTVEPAPLALREPARGLATPHTLRVDIGGAIVRAMVHHQDGHVLIPIRADIPADPSKDRPAGYVDILVRTDEATYARGLALAEAKGLTAVRLADIGERVFGHRALLSLEDRPLIER